MAPKTRPRNRLLVLCTSINDVTAWPFWKFLQMKRIKGVTDMAFLAFNSEGGSFEARIDGEKYSMKNYAKVQGYKQEMFQSFLERWYDPGRSYFVYGGHGMGDYLEFEQYKYGLQAHELATLLDKRRFEAILFDACFMSNLDCAYHLRNNTRYIGACEGYMWEPDTALDYHIFNTFTASAMSRYRDPKLVLETIQREYTSKAPRGDFAVLDTTHVAELRQFVQDHVIQRVYNRATFYNPAQQERLGVLAESALEESIRQFGQPGGESYLEELLTRKHLPATAPTSPDTYALTNCGRLTRKQRVAAAIQFEHSLYPSEVLDKHLVDLHSYLLDMVAEEEAAARGELTGASMRRSGRPLIRKAAAGAWSPSRAVSVDAHGTLPPARPLSCPGSGGGVGGASNGRERVVQVPAAAPGEGGAVACTAAGITHASTGGASLSTASPQSLCTLSNARRGLDLFNRVVVSHVAPRAAGIYAARLGGLSLAVHEYSAMSKPVSPWQVSRTILNKKRKLYLANGALAEVRMRREAAPVASMTSEGTETNATAASSMRGSRAGQVVMEAQRAAASMSAAAGTATQPMMITCHQASTIGASEPATTAVAQTSSTSVTSAATASLTLPLSVSASSPRIGAASTTAGALASFSTAYGSLSACSRNYASRSSSSSRRSRSLSSSSSSLASTPLNTLLPSPDGALVLRSRSADEVRDIQRMAMEGAQLLDQSPPW